MREERVTLLVADVGGSTALYEAVGDHEARRRVAGCLDTLAREVARVGGRVVKTLGDGLIATLPSVAAALEAAGAMRDGAAADGFAVRSAIHTGDVVTDAHGDVFGDAVNTVARLCDVAAQTEILLSESACSALPPERAARLVPLPPIALRGKREAVRLFALPSDKAGLATLADPTPGSGAQTITLSLAGGARRVEVGDRWLTLGRSEECDLVVPSARASRVHAKVFRMGANAYLTDTSSNGTWVFDDAGRTVRLYRERAPLTGAGRIYCGADPRAHADLPPVEFRVEPLDHRLP